MFILTADVLDQSSVLSTEWRRSKWHFPQPALSWRPWFHEPCLAIAWCLPPHTLPSPTEPCLKHQHAQRCPILNLGGAAWISPDNAPQGPLLLCRMMMHPPSSTSVHVTNSLCVSETGSPGQSVPTACTSPIVMRDLTVPRPRGRRTKTEMTDFQQTP